MNRAVTALCVSDNLSFLYDIIGALKVSGHLAIAAYSYPRALILAAAEQIDIIVIAEPDTQQESMLSTANLKFVRPDVPILLVAPMKHHSQALPSGVDMRAENVSDIESSIRVLFSPDFAKTNNGMTSWTDDKPASERFRST